MPDHARHEANRRYWDGCHSQIPRMAPSSSRTLADMINPLCDSGMILQRIVESPAGSARFWQDYSYEPAAEDSMNDWRLNPRAGLSVWLSVCAQKPG